MNNDTAYSDEHWKNLHGVAFCLMFNSNQTILLPQPCFAFWEDKRDPCVKGPVDQRFNVEMDISRTVSGQPCRPLQSRLKTYFPEVWTNLATNGTTDIGFRRLGFLRRKGADFVPSQSVDQRWRRATVYGRTETGGSCCGNVEFRDHGFGSHFCGHSVAGVRVITTVFSRLRNWFTIHSDNNNNN